MRALGFFASFFFTAAVLPCEQAGEGLSYDQVARTVFCRMATVKGAEHGSQVILACSMNIKRERSSPRSVTIAIAIDDTTNDGEVAVYGVRQLFHSCVPAVLFGDPLYPPVFDLLEANDKWIALNSAIFVGENHRLVEFEMFRSILIAYRMSSGRYLGQRHVGQNSARGIDCFGWGMTNVFCVQIEIDYHPGFHDVQTHRDELRETYPRALCNIHLVELIAHNSELVVHDEPLIVRENRIDRGRENCEEIERPLSRMKYESFERIKYIENRTNDSGPESTSSKQYKWFGALICLCGMVAVGKGLQWSDNERGYWPVAGGVMLLAGVFILWLGASYIF